MIIQLFDLPEPLEYNGELLRKRWSSEGGKVFVVKLGNNDKAETVIKMGREEAVEIQWYLNDWNPFWKEYWVNRVEELTQQLDAEVNRYEKLLDESRKEWLELYQENERLKEQLSEYELDNKGALW